ncbi:hypothetical protein QE152_g40066 [Popillia japonica]|uniref:Uncharacterized protein n=1 Tax=Popillia japonica TaxID=7064 RepID=A0AAW1HSM9_POPJA
MREEVLGYDSGIRSYRVFANYRFVCQSVDRRNQSRAIHDGPGAYVFGFLFRYIYIYGLHASSKINKEKWWVLVALEDKKRRKAG